MIDEIKNGCDGCAQFRHGLCLEFWRCTNPQRKYIEDILGDFWRRLRAWIRDRLEGNLDDDDKEWDAFIDRLVAIREGKGPADNGAWVPCEMKQPPKEGTYLTTTKSGAVRVNHYYPGGSWGYNNNAVAWRPLPEPWRAET